MESDVRPPILDEIKRSEILAILHVGCTRRVAARYVGCSPQTIQRTADRDPEFALRLARAENQAEVSYLNNINRAASEPRYWRAAAWALERKYPNRYASRHPDVMTLDETREFLMRLAAILAEEVSDNEQRARIIRQAVRMLDEIRQSAETSRTDCQSVDEGRTDCQSVDPCRTDF